MNQLRQLMLEELQRRNFAASTIRTYLHGVTHFSRYFRRPPDQLGPEDIRKYQAMLFTKLKYSPNTVIVRLSSLRFLYIHVLKRNWSIAETPYPKKLRHLPGVLSQEEVARLIDAADSQFHRILLMTLYATGARRAEAAHLKVSDIDSQRMVVHIREGKGGKDRDVMLSPKLLEELRTYWRGLRRKPKEWLFPGNRWHTSSHPVTTKVLWSACQIAAERAGLDNRRIHPHTLRHYSAFRTMPSGRRDKFVKARISDLNENGAKPPLDIVLEPLQVSEEAKKVIFGAITNELALQRSYLFERHFFHRQSGFKVDLSCLDRFMPEPQGNDRTIYARLEQIEGHRVSKDVNGDTFSC